ncbi:MAG: glycosyltransferase family 39 protein [bacterium]
MGAAGAGEDHAAVSALPASGRKKTGRYLLFVLLVSFLLRWALLECKEVVGTDEVIYLALGKSLWHGQGFRLLDHPVTQCPPLLPLVTGLFSRFTENLEAGTNFTYVFFGGLLVLPYFHLARRVHGERVARLAALLLACYPGLLLSFYWGSMTEPLYTFLLVCAFLFAHRALREGTARDFALCGILLALVYLTRSEGVLFLPAFWLLAVVSLGVQGRLLQWKSMRNLALMAVCFALVSAPYPLFLKKHSGGLSVSGKTKLILLAGAMNPVERERLLGKLTEDGGELFDYQELVRGKTVLGMILENPKVLLGGSALQAVRFVSTLLSWKVFPAFLLGFVVLGLFRDPWDRARLKNEGFLLFACLPFLVFLTFHVWPRYLLPMTPVLLLGAARGVCALEDWLRETAERIGGALERSRRRILWIPRLAVFLPLAVILAAKPIKAKMLVQYPIEYKSAGRWMDAHLPEDARILARKPEIAYYARRIMHPLPNEDLARVLQYARAQSVEYLVVDEFFIATRPQLEPLLHAGDLPQDLRLLHEESAPSGRSIRVFQILGATGPPDTDGG